MRNLPILALAASALYVSPALAQSEPTADAWTLNDGDKIERQVDVRRPAQSPLGDQSGGFAPSTVSTVASSGDSDVSITVSTKPKGIGTAGAFYSSLTLSAPIKEGASEGGFLTQQGLPNKFSAKIGVSFVLLDTRAADSGLVAEAGRLVGLADARCRAALVASDAAFRALDAEAQTGAASATRDNAIEEALNAKCEKDKPLDQRAKAYRALYLTEDDRRQVLGVIDDLIGKRDLVLLNFSASIGNKKFAYLDPASFADASKQRTPYALSASIGYQPSRTAPFLAAGFEYKQDYKAGSERFACPPGATTPDGCKYEIFDAPTSDRSHAAFALVRFANVLGGKAATLDAPGTMGPVLEIKGAYDFVEKRFGISAPLYFLLDADGSTKGGVRFEWQERGDDPKEDRTRFSVFVTKSFGFMDL